MSEQPMPEPTSPGAVVPTGNVPALVDPHEVKAREKGWSYMAVEHFDIPVFVQELMEGSVAREHNVLPVGIKEQSLFITCGNPDDYSLRATLAPLFPGRTIRFMYSEPNAIRRKIDVIYSARAEAEALADQERRERAVAAQQGVTGGDLGRVYGDESDNRALLRLVIEQALREDASDIHFEPTEHSLQIRFRVDGKLRHAVSYPSTKTDELMTLIKVDSPGMRSDNFLVPDSGVLIFKQPGKKAIDIRVETAPTAWGTSCVMRLQQNIWRPLSTLGFSEYNIERYKRALWQPSGVILTTGPTGSGKSTTLYASLNERIDPEVKIITLENPIEYKSPEGLSQMSINIDQGITFAGGLRSTLRQDPDIILVGEIRDEATAEAAVDAAMTGHLVFSTLHTNDAPGAIPRLTRMGIEPLMVADQMLCIVGQRLTRRLCEACKTTAAPNRDQMAAWGFDNDRIPDEIAAPAPGGCVECNFRGYAGRVPIHEVMLISEEMKDLIAENGPQSTLGRLAREAGMRPMREDGFEKALEGITSISEVAASTRQDLV